MIDNKVLKTLEFDKILAEAASFASSDFAASRILETVPSASLSRAQTLLDETKEADKVLFEFSKNPTLGVDDVSEALTLAKKLSTLTIGDLIKIGRLLRISQNLDFLTKLSGIKLLAEKAACLHTDKALEKEIYDAFPSDTEVADNASHDLRTIRSKIRRCNESIKTKLSQIINSSANQKYLQDNLVTMRGDRYVIPLKAEFKGMIAGLIHDQSSSGATLYVEPMQVVEMNNDLKTLLIEEKLEIERILRDFTSRIAENADELKLNFEVIIDLDIIFARAQWSKSANAFAPVLNNNGYVAIDGGRHPLIAREKVVPVSITLGKGFDILLITGPNTGGKTVTLKLVGLFTIMALSGLFIPARYAELSFFDNVFCDIGDEQSIEQSLSTFSSHMKNIINIIDRLSESSLVLFDELGAGTDPSEGAALAVAVTDYLLNRGAKAIITTHFNDLKEFSASSGRIENASMDFDINTFEPTYHLVMGAIGASNALQISKRLGLKEEIIENALSRLSSEKKDFENVLLSAETTRKRAESLTKEAAEDREEARLLLQEIKTERNQLALQREKMNENVRKETKKLIENSVYEAEQVIDEIREILEKGDALQESDLFNVRKLKKRLENFSAEYEEEEVFDVKPDNSPLKEGDTVFVKTVNQSGTVTALTAKGASVKIGNIVMQVKKSDFVKIKPGKPQKSKITANVQPSVAKNAKSEIILIGQNTDEAIYNADTFLAEATLAGLSEVRIVHGKGLGKLRDALQKHFKNNPYVAEFRDGKYGEGEKGVTIVTLK